MISAGLRAIGEVREELSVGCEAGDGREMAAASPWTRGYPREGAARKEKETARRTDGRSDSGDAKSKPRNCSVFGLGVRWRGSRGRGENLGTFHCSGVVRRVDDRTFFYKVARGPHPEAARGPHPGLSPALPRAASSDAGPAL